MCGWRWPRWALVALLLLAWVLRLPLATVHPLHPDEALYGYWALRIGWRGDPWLASVPVYKPPLLPYLLTLGLALAGRSELVVRWLGLSASLLTVSLTAALTQALYRDGWTMIVAAVAVALSPLAITFSATAFLDPPMVALGLAACLAAARGRSGGAGLLAGLSLAAKQTGLVWMPLIVILSCSLATSSGGSRLRHAQSDLAAQSFLSLVGGWLVVVGLIFGWDAVRVSQGAQSFWREGIVGYGGVRLIWPQELWPRLAGWAATLRQVFASPVINVLLVIGLPFFVGQAIFRRLDALECFIDLVLIAFGLTYFLIHWLFAFPVWDRYFLPLVPVLALLMARTFHFLLCRERFVLGRSLLPHVAASAWVAISMLVLIALLIVPAIRVIRDRHNRYHVGGARAIYDGLGEVTAFLQARSEGAVVYHHWLGWQYHFYLFNAPVFLAYWPTPAWLARDVMAFGEREPRYIVFPAWESSARVGRALAQVGYRLTSVLEPSSRVEGASSFTVYRVESLAN